MRTYKSITDYLEYPKVDAIEDLKTKNIYSLDYCTYEIFSMKLGDGVKEYFIKLPDGIEIWHDELCFYE